MVNSDLGLTLSAAVARLGENGEYKLRSGGIKAVVKLTGRHRTPEGVESEPRDIPPRALMDCGPTKPMRFNLERNSIEANASATFTEFERLVDFGWEDVEAAEHEVAALAKSIAGGKYVSNAAETQCREWLARVMDEFPPISSTDCRAVAKQVLKHLGARSFERAWSDATRNAENGAAWSRPGPRPAPSPETIDRITALLNS